MNILNQRSFHNKILEETEGEYAEGDSEEMEDTVSYGQTPQNEFQIKQLMENSKKMIKVRKKHSHKEHMKLRLVGDKSLRSLYQAVSQNKQDVKKKLREKSLPYGTLDDPEYFFKDGRNSPQTESLNSITSQNDYDDHKEQDAFRFETEKKLFAPAQLKKKRKYRNKDK